jgi:hypothetical protein
VEPLVAQRLVGVEDDLGEVGEGVTGAGTSVYRRMTQGRGGVRDAVDADVLLSPLDGERTSHVSHGGLCEV